MRIAFSVLFCATALFAAQAPAPKASADACVPPPSGAAPPLPAKLLEGQGDLAVEPKPRLYLSATKPKFERNARMRAARGPFWNPGKSA